MPDALARARTRHGRSALRSADGLVRHSSLAVGRTELARRMGMVVGRGTATSEVGVEGYIGLALVLALAG